MQHIFRITTSNLFIKINTFIIHHFKIIFWKSFGKKTLFGTVNINREDTGEIRMRIPRFNI